MSPWFTIREGQPSPTQLTGDSTVAFRISMRSREAVSQSWDTLSATVSANLRHAGGLGGPDCQPNPISISIIL